MGRCNYCDVLNIKRKAKESNQIVTVLRDARWGMGGSNVYVHPSSVDVKALPGGEDGRRARYRVMWAMSLPDHCAC